jgi:4-hydroxybenzoate polyprenyltransferase
MADLLWLTWLPLWNRIRRGEGALLAVNGALAAATHPALATLAGAVALSGLVLTIAYGINDWRDAEHDLRNPKKDKRLIQAILERRRPFLVWLCGLHAAAFVLALGILGPRSAAAVGTMLAVNFLYSWWVKGAPALDLVAVVAWGASYAAIVSPSPVFWASVGLMTGMMHVFQMQQDRWVDAANEVSTTAVRLPQLVTLSLAGLCILLAAILYRPLGPLGALSAFIPLGLRLLLVDTGRAWMACRVYCGFALLWALWITYGPV